MADDWKNYQNYFKVVPDGFVSGLFENAEYPWSPLAILKEKIIDFFNGREQQGALLADKKVFKGTDGSFKEGSYFIQESQILEHDFVDPDLKIFIGAGTLVEAGATIKDHVIIEPGCEVRQGAYLRGVVFVGTGSVVGHTTEMKNSIFIRHVEAGHFAYIGDTIVGAYVNLGAGTKISNLQFRSYKEKKEELFPELSFHYEGETIKTGLSKLGAIIGDGVESGCNTVLCPCVFLEPECWIMPNQCVLKGVYTRRSIRKLRQ